MIAFQMMHPLIARLLEDRKVDDFESYLNPVYENRPDPFLMKGMDDAVSRILQAIERKETVAVWSDYDCDGVPGGAMLYDFFRMIRFPVIPYIPERSDGYGLNKTGIQKLCDQGVTLIVTVDCGITAVDEVSFAKSLGVSVIVTDHHLPLEEGVPDAVAVLNPHQHDCPYPFKELCGTGVAFKLVEGLLQRKPFDIPKGFEKWLLDLVALATVADMMVLTGENRTLVRYGLAVLKKGKRKGLRALLKKMNIPLAAVTEDDFSFSIAPKINAASRMKSPMLAWELLTTEDDARAEVLAKELVRLNDARKLEGARVAKEVKRRLEGVVLDEVIVLGNSEWKPSLLGIAATNVVETYHRTVCLWGKDGELIKGSCRSDGSVNIVSLMRGASEVLLDFGGHELSGGFSVKSDALHTLPEVLRETYAQVKTLAGTEAVKNIQAIPISLPELTASFYEALRTLAPFGLGNEKPLFQLSQIRVENILTFGTHKEHMRLTLSDEQGAHIDAISFFVSRTPFYDTLQLLSKGDVVAASGSFEQSFFRNKKELRLRLEGLVVG